MTTPAALDEIEDVLQGRHDYIVNATRRLIPAAPRTPSEDYLAEIKEQVASFAVQLDAWNAATEDERYRRMYSLLSEPERRIVEEANRKRSLEIIGLLDQVRAAMEAQEELMRRRAERRRETERIYRDIDQDPKFFGELPEGGDK